MISYVVGPLGAGKSAFGVMRGARALLSGRVFASNIGFVEGWEHQLLKHAPHYLLAGRRARKEYRIEVASRYFYNTDLATLVALRLHGHGEGRGVRVIDEAHNALNNRDWAENNQKLQLRKMTLARKRGWEDYIIAQHSNNTDAALRRVATVEIELTNWRQVLQLPIFHSKLLPFHVFLSRAFALEIRGNSVARKKKPMWRELHTLGWWAKLYDTFEDFDVEGDEDAVRELWLPLRAGAPAVQSGGSAARGSNGAIVLSPRRGTSYGVKSTPVREAK